jgi:DNA-directed RNA polymerase III subunit RPC4
LTPSSWGARRPNSSAPRFIEDQDIDQYSDNEDDVTPGETRARRVIDMAEVSALGESAPTSLVRDRRLNEKGKVKAESKIKKDKEKEKKRRARREAAGGQAMDVDEEDVVRVKPEPISPEKRPAQLPARSGGREDDAMVSDDEVQDRDQRGRRLRVEAGEVQEEVNTAQMVDLSESEDEDYEEDMEGDFVPVDGLVSARHHRVLGTTLRSMVCVAGTRLTLVADLHQDNPQDKLYIFQFPHLFPRFEAPGPVDMTQEDTKEGIKDVKPSLAALRGRKKAAPPPQGRIGTLVVMKSGKVKMVMGDDIVMNVRRRGFLAPTPPTPPSHSILHLLCSWDR